MSANKETLTITDNRTGQQYEVPIEHDTIRAMDLRQIKVNTDDFRFTPPANAKQVFNAFP